MLGDDETVNEEGEIIASEEMEQKEESTLDCGAMGMFGGVEIGGMKGLFLRPYAWKPLLMEFLWWCWLTVGRATTLYLLMYWQLWDWKWRMKSLLECSWVMAIRYPLWVDASP